MIQSRRPTANDISRRTALSTLAMLGLPVSNGLASEAASQSNTLVQIFLRGALDGLSAVVPVEEPRYFQARPRIAVRFTKRQSAEHRLDDRFSLHPSLAGMLPLWREGRVGVVVATGMPRPTRSHFEAQDIVETGGDSQMTASGWLTRVCQGAGWPEDPLQALSFESAPAVSLLGHPRRLAISNLARFDGSERGQFAERLRGALSRLYPGTTTNAVDLVAARALTSSRRLAALGVRESGELSALKYPESGLAKNLSQLAAVLKREPSVRVVTLSASGFDTHRQQGNVQGPLANRLRDLGDSLAAFMADLGERSERVMVVVVTEFGRTVMENSTAGTDHGHGSVSFVLGGKVKGGVHGLWPGLGPDQGVTGRELAVTTDYRAVLAQVAEHHLGVPHEAHLFPADLVGAAELDLFAK